MDPSHKLITTDGLSRFLYWLKNNFLLKWSIDFANEEGLEDSNGDTAWDKLEQGYYLYSHENYDFYKPLTYANGSVLSFGGFDPELGSLSIDAVSSTGDFQFIGEVPVALKLITASTVSNTYLISRKNCYVKIDNAVNTVTFSVNPNIFYVEGFSENLFVGGRVILRFRTGASPNITFTNSAGGSIVYSTNYSIKANTDYEIIITAGGTRVNNSLHYQTLYISCATIG